MAIKGHRGLAHLRRVAQQRTKHRRWRVCMVCKVRFHAWVRWVGGRFGFPLRPLAERYICRPCSRGIIDRRPE